LRFHSRNPAEAVRWRSTFDLNVKAIINWQFHINEGNQSLLLKSGGVSLNREKFRVQLPFLHLESNPKTRLEPLGEPRSRNQARIPETGKSIILFRRDKAGKVDSPEKRMEDALFSRF
jgi:hypothetical protein